MPRAQNLWSKLELKNKVNALKTLLLCNNSKNDFIAGSWFEGVSKRIFDNIGILTDYIGSFVIRVLIENEEQVHQVTCSAQLFYAEINPGIYVKENATYLWLTSCMLMKLINLEQRGQHRSPLKRNCYH